MDVEYTIEDFGNFRRLHAIGSHKHKKSKECNSCYLDSPLSLRFLTKLIDWDSQGVFHFIEGRLLTDSKSDLNTRAKKAVERFIPDLNGKRALDFGSGIGQLSLYLSEKGPKEIILTEIDGEMLDLSEIYLDDFCSSGNFKHHKIGENDNLSFIKNESIDLIVSANVFEHILPEYRKDILVNLYSKLRPGGIIIITAPNRLFPKDGHTTGLWFAAWLPTKIGAWYARTFSSRCKGWSTEKLLVQGLRQYSYFEAKRILVPLGAEDLCSKNPVKNPLEDAYPQSFRKRIYYKTLFISHKYFLKYFGPWEAWQRYVLVAWAKPSKPTS